MNDMQNTDKNQMKSLSACMADVVKDGYIDNMKVEHGKLYAPSKDKQYAAEEVTIDNFYRFEGESDPADNSVLYAIQTSDGVKGILIDAYGTYADGETNKFIKEVESIHKEAYE